MDLNQYKPAGKLIHKHLTSLIDYSATDIYEILSMAIKLKKLHKKGKPCNILKNQTLAMIFAKSSTRTRVSFEQGIKQLGGTSLFLSTSDIQLGRGETIADTARTLSRYDVNGVMIRTFKQSDVDELAKHGDFCVINGLTDDFHPCQALADMLTIYEVYGRFEGLKLVYSGDSNNVTNSLILAGTKLGMEVVCASPENFKPSVEIMDLGTKFGNVTVTQDTEAAFADADIVYTDVFFSMGQETAEAKRKALEPYRVTTELMAKAKKSAVFMHCLPAHRGEEVDAEVIDSPCSVVFEQAENRLHAQKAVMALLMNKGK